jgi:redox-sensitive bicupin YhaK (pirin superfamily)
MMRVYPAQSRHSFNHGWLSGSFSFSFGEYYDPDNTSFGPMRVCNDDTIAPGKGFGAHPHSDMEILSIVLKGELRHEDNLGNVVVTRFGEVQRMSAGTGVIHTEHNPSETEEVNLLQLWFAPQRKGLPPSYEATRYDPDALRGRLVPVASHAAVPGAVAKLHQNMTVYLSRLMPGERLEYAQPAGRRVFLFVIEGALGVQGDEAMSPVHLARRDSVRIEQEPKLLLVSEAASGETFLLLIDLP